MHQQNMIVSEIHFYNSYDTFIPPILLDSTTTMDMKHNSENRKKDNQIK